MVLLFSYDSEKKNIQCLGKERCSIFEGVDSRLVSDGLLHDYVWNKIKVEVDDDEDDEY